jgi:hypothetical protein
VIDLPNQPGFATALAQGAFSFAEAVLADVVCTGNFDDFTVNIANFRAEPCFVFVNLFEHMCGGTFLYIGSIFFA